MKPDLAGGDFAPRSVAPGATITLTYEVVKEGGAPVPAVLGASIRPAGGRWIDDPANDRPVTVPPGRTTHTRTFRVPDGAPAGDYEVWTTLLSGDKASR